MFQVMGRHWWFLKSGICFLKIKITHVMTCSLTGEGHSRDRRGREEAVAAGKWGCQGPEWSRELERVDAKGPIAEALPGRYCLLSKEQQWCLGLANSFQNIHPQPFSHSLSPLPTRSKNKMRESETRPSFKQYPCCHYRNASSRLLISYI